MAAGQVMLGIFGLLIFVVRIIHIALYAASVSEKHSPSDASDHYVRMRRGMLAMSLIEFFFWIFFMLTWKFASFGISL